MSYQTIRVRFRDPICFIQFDRPEDNNTINARLIVACHDVRPLVRRGRPVWQVAEKPRLSRITLKEPLVAPVCAELPGIIAKEVAMHAKTFHQPEVKERIMTLFGP